MITQELANHTFTYDKDEPLAIRWKTVPKHSGHAAVGKIAGHWHPIHAKSPILHRYAGIGGKKRVPVSHIVWTMHNGRPPKRALWFLNGGPGDCRIENLTEKKPSMSPEELKGARHQYYSDWRNGKSAQEWTEFLRRRNLARDYGITVEIYDAALTAQKSLCAICLRPETMKRKGVVPPLSVDHCHTTKKVRGLLCTNCNNGLGRFDDDPERLLRAIEYLKAHLQSFP